MEYKSEAQLQSLCTKWHRVNYLEQWDDLILIYNNPPNAAMAGLLKSMGLHRGASDQLYFNWNRMKMVWIEYKLQGRKQSDDQIRFQKKVEAFGCEYFVIKNEEEFYFLIRKLNEDERKS